MVKAVRWRRHFSLANEEEVWQLYSLEGPLSTGTAKSRSLLLVETLALAAAYFGCGKFGLSLAYVNASASAVWPPAGLALAALLFRGQRLWPGVFLGAFLVNITTQGSTATSLGIAAGNTLEAALGAWLVSRFASGLEVFDRARNIFKFVLLAGVLSTAVSACLGVTSLCLGGFARWEQYWLVWFTWWLGDMAGDLVIAPLLVIWATQPRLDLSAKRLVEAAGLLLTVLVVAQIIFLGKNPFFDPNAPLGYCALLPLLWAAFRFGQRGAVTSAFVTSGVALWGTLHGFGPFVKPGVNESLLFGQTFVGTINVTALVLAAVVSERKGAEKRLQIQDAVSRVLAEAPTLKEATPRIFQALCEKGGWELGAIWQVDRSANELRCVEVWHLPSLAVPEFEATTKERRFPPGIGLPGRVWSSGQPAWIADVTKDSNFPRAAAASQEGIHAAFCFPLKLGAEILGVIECFSRQVREPDQQFLGILTALGSQLGQFIERKQAEEALRESREMLRQYAETLERRVEERTAKLQETIQSLDGFCYSIAHDLRAPLRALGGFSAELASQYSAVLDDAGKEYLRRIQGAATRMDQLILDLLRFGRLDTAELSAETVRLEAVIARALTPFEAQIKTKSAQVRLKAPLLAVRANAVMVEQILANLLDNALKFVPPTAAPQVEIWTEARDALVRVCVQDNGIGIKADYAKKLFQPFVRLVNGENYPGTGIGLAIVRKGVERMGGRVGVDSEPGQGSCFWIELPGAQEVEALPASVHDTATGAHDS